MKQDVQRRASKHMGNRVERRKPMLRKPVAAALDPLPQPGRTYIPATRAKNNFATVLEDAIKGQTVVITKHNTAKAVVMSVETFHSLSAASASGLRDLSAEFDARLARMQTVPARTAMQEAFEASSKELGRAAVKAARSRS